MSESETPPMPNNPTEGRSNNEERGPVIPKVKIEEKQEERLVSGISEGVSKELGKQTQKIVEGVNELKGILERYLEKLEREEIPEERGKIEEIIKKNNEVISNLGESMGYYARQQEIYNQLLQGQTPELLQIPTPERLLSQRTFSEDELIKLQSEGLIEKVERTDLETGREVREYKVAAKGNIYSNEIYQSKVEEWFEGILRHLETFETAFEENPEIYQRLVIALTFFKFKDETSPLADKLQRRIEARRLKQRMVRLWNLVPPDQLTGEAGRFNMDIIKELFTYETKDGDKPIEREFHKYESMASELQRRREELGPRAQLSPEQKDEYDGRVIKDYFEHGGKTTLEGREVFVDEAIRILEERKARGEGLTEDQNVLLRKLKNDLWARRTAGGLWSITFRAARFNVVMNGVGDFFAARVINFADSLEQRTLAKNTKGIWRPDRGRYRGKDFNLGFKDFFADVLGGNDFSEDWRRRMGIQIEDGDVVSLENARLGDEEFWEGLRSVGVPKSKFGDKIEKFQSADETRKVFWEAGSYFHDPTLEKFLSLINFFKHIPEAERQEKWEEILVRTFEWMDTPEGKEQNLAARVFPASEKFIWIDMASDHKMLTNEQEDKLLGDYLNLPVLPGLGSIKGRAQITVLLDTMYGALVRYPPMRNRILLGWLLEAIKRALQYTFS